MDWAGIGVLLIGLASLAVAILLIKPLRKLTELLSSLQDTTGELPGQVASVMEDASSTLRSGTAAINDVNRQLSKLNPAIQVAGDIGSAIKKLSASATAINQEMRAKTDNRIMERYNLEWVYGIAALGYCIWQRKK
ncbi:DUF948 domain-containing protein [Lentibacillus cibarius]|uniref:DUF948 domain-containing protein n=1 Tax=Lentibacillus cibarius TaxID=2583219 RepID=A0A5S3QL04_9BACI|nr:DUF948 domain-containing protein [Lentibacillus cibarius]TMN22417.1 DUF948 domain-containing protein [Lentibacillus cibarius]